MQLKKNINLGKNNFLLILLILSLFFSVAKSETVNDEKFVEIKITQTCLLKGKQLNINAALMLLMRYNRLLVSSFSVPQCCCAGVRGTFITQKTLHEKTGNKKYMQ